MSKESIVGPVPVALSAGTNTPSTSPSIPSPTPDYLVIIVMENHGINATYNCGSNCTYTTQLADTYSLAKTYSALTHPSMANYIAMTSGGLYGTRDVQPPGSVNATNIVDSLENDGLTWKAYMESYHGGCSDYGTSEYSDNHNPFVKYVDIYNNPARCARIVNAGSDASNESSPLLSDLASGSAPNYMWLSPNKCHQMHDCSVSVGSSYLASLIPKILDSYIFMTQDAALFITFDEGCCAYPKDYVTTIWAGPMVKQGYRSTLYYDHYSFLRTVETFWDLPTLTSNDTAATPMSEFFSSTKPPKFSLSNSGPIEVVRSGSAYTTITIEFSASNALSTRFTCLSGLPQGSSCIFNPSSGYSCPSTCPVDLKVSTSSLTTVGSYAVNIIANDGATNSTQFTLTVLQPFQLRGDVTGDCRVNIFDLAMVAGNFGKNVGHDVNPRTDLNLDGKISIADLVTTASGIGKTCS